MAIRFYILFAIIISIIPKQIYAQDWEQWETLFQDRSIKVEVRFMVEANGCNENKKNLIDYRVTGTLNSFSDYIVWQTDYTDCNGNLFFQEHSLDISTGNDLSNGNPHAQGDTWSSPKDEFIAKNIVRKFYAVRRTQSPSNNSGPQIPQLSTAAVAIDGDTKVYFDYPTTLSVNGGQLGTGANWIWYKNSCGGEKIGEGASINLMPLEDNIYFVRAEGANITKCVQKTVYVISKPPDIVNGGGDIKLDDSTILTVSGGSLTLGSRWVWYENSCNGNKIGEGESLTVGPVKKTTYYVRGEGKSNITDCVSVDVSILPRDPVAIVGDTSVMFGETSKLSIDGGYLGHNDKWVWYENSCGGKKVFTGDVLAISVIEPSTYFVRSEGGNPTTNCAQITITPHIPITHECNNKNPYFDTFDFIFKDGKVKFNYKIKNRKASDRYSISIKGFEKSGKLNLNSLSGPVNNSQITRTTKAIGNNQVIWDAATDGYTLKDKVAFNISASVTEKIQLIPHFTKSLVFPGWGDVHLRNKKTRLLYGILGYALISTSVYFNMQSNQNYNAYKQSMDVNYRDQFYNKAVLQNYISLSCATTACVLWSIDLVGIVSKRHKVKKELTPESSKYYYERSRNLFNAFSTTKALSTN